MDITWPKCPYCKETMFMTRSRSGSAGWCCGCDANTMEGNYKKYNDIRQAPVTRLRCDQCRFWNKDNSLCRRFPPDPNYPTTEGFDWCGEWREGTA